MKYTVVGICECGCEDTFVYWPVAKGCKQAATKVLKEREQRGRVIAVFPGHIKDLLPYHITLDGK